MSNMWFTEQTLATCLMGYAVGIVVGLAIGYNWRNR